MAKTPTPSGPEVADPDAATALQPEGAVEQPEVAQAADDADPESVGEPIEPESAAAVAQREAKRRAALDAILKGKSPVREDDIEKQIEDALSPDGEPEASGDDEPGTGDDGEVPDTSGKKPVKQPEDEDLDDDATPTPRRLSEDKMILAYRRDGHSDEQIEKIRKAIGEDEFAKAAMKKHKRQTDVDARLGVNDDGDSPDGDAEDSRRATAPDAGSAFTDQRLKDIEKAIDEAYDTEAATRLKSEFRELADAARAGQQAANERTRELLNTRWRAAVTELAGNFPMLTEPTAKQWAQLRQVLGALDPEGSAMNSQRDFTRLVRKAAAAVFVDVITKDARTAVIASNKRVRAGQMTAPRSPQSSQRPLTREQYERAMLKIVKANSGNQKVIDETAARLRKRGIVAQR